MTDFPVISLSRRLQNLQPRAGLLRIVLDTDTYNEVDDQFALAYALLSTNRLKLEAIYAAPFHNNRSTGPADGMERSHTEILRLLDLMQIPATDRVFRGSTRYLIPSEAEESPAVRDLIDRALSSPDNAPLYVVAIAAITNIVNAILLEPDIIEKIVVVWLGGHALHWPHTREFNLKQDVTAAQILFNCGVPLIHVPCEGVTTHLQTTVPELQHYLHGRNALCDYLVDIVSNYEGNPYAWSKVIWDVAAIAVLLDDGWVPTQYVHTPILTDQITWSVDQSRHMMRYANYVYRDPVFADLFEKLARF